MATRLTELQWVRDLTTSDTSLITDARINQYLLEHMDKPRKSRVYLAAADVLQNILIQTDEEWQSIKLGDREYQGNLTPGKIEKYRRLAFAYNFDVN